MKKCLRCEQVYGEDVNFCLTDGSTLVSLAGATDFDSETPTVFSGADAPTIPYNQPLAPPTQKIEQPFTPPVSYQTAAPPPAETKKSNTLLIALVVGFFALLVGGAIVGAVMYGLNSSNKKDTNIANVADNANQNSAASKADNENQAQNLKAQQEKLDRDKKKLEDERKALEAKKKQTAQTTPSNPNATTATIIDPPTNIRAAPNGTIICVMRQRGTVVNILGSSGVSDNNGTWYYTDACGRQGVIHSSQIRF